MKGLRNTIRSTIARLANRLDIVAHWYGGAIDRAVGPRGRGPEPKWRICYLSWSQRLIARFELWLLQDILEDLCMRRRVKYIIEKGAAIHLMELERARLEEEAQQRREADDSGEWLGIGAYVGEMK